MADEVDFPQHLCGWLGVDHIQRFHASAFQGLSALAPQLFGAPTPTDPVLLYKAWKDVLGSYPAYAAQAIGDCTSFGHGHGNDLLQAIEARLNKAAVYAETDTEFIYGSSREVAGILSNQDGCYGSACVKAMTTVGMVSRSMLGANGVYSGNRAKDWGLNGPPADLKTTAARFKLGAAAAVTSWDELVAAITNGYPVTCCFSEGFTLTRDSQGFCKRKGKWGHCEVFAGVRFDRPGACLMQSWGPDMPTGPVDLDQPDYSFWIDQDEVDRMLGEGDSWALSKAPTFSVRPLPPSWSYRDLA